VTRHSVANKEEVQGNHATRRGGECEA